jgi:hypothetical protein
VIVLRKYTLLMPAELARLELASHGIESVILDEALGSLAPYLFLCSGIRLAVAEEDEQAAERVLVAMEERNDGTGAPEGEENDSL